MLVLCRGEVVCLCGEVLCRYKDVLGLLVVLEMGKSKLEGDGEVQEMIDIVDFVVGQSCMLYGYIMYFECFGYCMYEQYYLLGLVGIILVFNFLVVVWSWNLFLVVICGDVCIWKLFNKMLLIVIVLLKICNDVLCEVGFLDIFFLINDVGIVLLEKMVDDCCVLLISFIGLIQVGCIVNEKVVCCFGCCLLEFGGNNVIILDEIVDLKLVVLGIVFGVVGIVGQCCIIICCLIVYCLIYVDVLFILVKVYKQVEGKIGDLIDVVNLMGLLNSEGVVQQFFDVIVQVKVVGGIIEIGGICIDCVGNFVLFVIVIGLKNSDVVVQYEIFVLILYVMLYDSIDEVIDMQNGVLQGLLFLIFIQNLKIVEKFLLVVGSDCGIVNINIGMFGVEIGGVFGGEKDIGGGCEFGLDVWKVYMCCQINIINYLDLLLLVQGIKFDL